MKSNSIFPIIVVAFSVFAIVDAVFSTNNWLSLANSIVGISGCALYFKKDQRYRLLIHIWIYLQFVVITKTISGVAYPVFDLTQFLQLKFGITLSFNENSYFLGFNPLPLLYLFTFRKLQTKDLIGEQLTLSLYRSNDILNPVLPQTVKVIDVIDFDKSKSWLLGQLSKPIEVDEKLYEYCLIKGKDDVPVVPDKEGQMVHLRLASNVIGQHNSGQLNDHTFIDWALVR